MKTDDDPQADAEQRRAEARLLPEGYTWRSVLVEVFIVVAGVLVAFALNSWWQGRLADAREQAHLRALQADFQENVDRLTYHIDVEQRTMEASRALLTLLKDGHAVPPDSTRRLLIDVFSSGRFQPVMGAYEALLGSGGLELISDDSLRAGLAAFTSMSENRYGTWLANEYYLDFNRNTIAHLHEAGFLDPTSDLPVEKRGGDLTPLLEDPRFRGHLAMRYYAERDVMRYYQELLGPARLVVRRLEASLRR